MNCVEVFPQCPDLEIKVLHFKQRYNWDCGISCIIMVLPIDKRIEFLDNFYQICQVSGFNKNTWTIDLCYLLKIFGIDHIYNTITLGVNPDFKNYHFYCKIFDRDKERVLRLFQNAEDNGLTVKKLSLNMDDLINHLKNHGPIIVLVNSHYLTCDNCIPFRLYINLCRCLPWKVPYYGHYIVICGYSLVEEKVFYRNPSRRDQICKMSFNDLTKARKSHGTDEDVILIFSKNKSN